MNKQQDAEAFIKIWMEAKESGKTQRWVADKIGTSRQAVTFKANRLRAKGVKLPSLMNASPKSGLDVEKLNQLIRTM